MVCVCSMYIIHRYRAAPLKHSTQPYCWTWSADMVSHLKTYGCLVYIRSIRQKTKNMLMYDFFFLALHPLLSPCSSELNMFVFVCLLDISLLCNVNHLASVHHLTPISSVSKMSVHAWASELAHRCTLPLSVFYSSQPLCGKCICIFQAPPCVLSSYKWGPILGVHPGHLQLQQYWL